MAEGSDPVTYRGGVTLRYEGGEAASPPGQQGTATVLDRLLLRSATKHVPAGDYARLLARAGATGVFDSTWNGGTSFDVTLPANQLALPLWLWSDQMGFFPTGLPDADIALEKSKLRDQQRAVLDGSPMARVDLFAGEELFPSGHPSRAGYLPPESVERIVSPRRGTSGEGLEVVAPDVAEIPRDGNQLSFRPSALDRAGRPLCARRLGAVGEAPARIRGGARS